MNAIDATAPWIEHVVHAIPVWSEGIRDEIILFITNNRNRYIPGAPATIAINYAHNIFCGELRFGKWIWTIGARESWRGRPQISNHVLTISSRNYRACSGYHGRLR